MNKENILYGIIGLLLGCIIGFVFANKVNNQSGPQPRTNPMTANSNLPADHPPTGDGALPEVSAALQEANEQPNNFEAQMKAASLYAQIRRFDKAVEFYERANKIKPDDYDAIVQLGNANFDAGRFEEAEKFYTIALSKKPDDISVRTDLGLTFFLRQPPDYDKAIKEFEGSLKRDPNHKQTLYNITSSFIKKGDFQKAKEYLVRLEKADPTNQDIANLRSQIEKQTGKP
jgi:tetratricopeptide (TPR) repeat protein